MFLEQLWNWKFFFPRIKVDDEGGGVVEVEVEADAGEGVLGKAVSALLADQHLVVGGVRESSRVAQFDSGGILGTAGSAQLWLEWQKKSNW